MGGGLLGRSRRDPREQVQNCHRPGQVSPFSLLSYDDAQALGDDPRSNRRPPDASLARRSALSHFVNDPRPHNQNARFWLGRSGHPWVTQSSAQPRQFPEGWTIVSGVCSDARDLHVPPGWSHVYFRVPTNQRETCVGQAPTVPANQSVVTRYRLCERSKAARGPGGRPRPTVHRLRPGDAPISLPEGYQEVGGADLLFRCTPPIGRVGQTAQAGVGLLGTRKPRAFTIGIANPDLLLPARQTTSRWRIGSPFR